MGLNKKRLQESLVRAVVYLQLKLMDAVIAGDDTAPLSVATPTPVTPTLLAGFREVIGNHPIGAIHFSNFSNLHPINSSNKPYGVVVHST